MRRLGVYSAFDSLVRLFSIWTIPGDVPLIFSVEKIVLLALPLFLVFAPISALAIFLCLVGPSGYVLCSCLRRFLPLLAIARLLNIENLLALALLLLLLALACITSLSIPVVSVLLFLVLLFQSCGGHCLIYNTS
jgi:hypothetical protein